MPEIVDMAVPFAHTHFAKAALAVQGPARMIAGDHLRLQRPVSVGFGYGDQPFQEGLANALALCAFGDIDADLSDPGGASRVGDRCQRGPAA